MEKLKLCLQTIKELEDLISNEDFLNNLHAREAACELLATLFEFRQEFIKSFNNPKVENYICKFLGGLSTLDRNHNAHSDYRDEIYHPEEFLKFVEHEIYSCKLKQNIEKIIVNKTFTKNDERGEITVGSSRKYNHPNSNYGKKYETIKTYNCLNHIFESISNNNGANKTDLRSLAFNLRRIAQFYYNRQSKNSIGALLENDQIRELFAEILKFRNEYLSHPENLEYITEQETRIASLADGFISIKPIFEERIEQEYKEGKLSLDNFISIFPHKKQEALEEIDPDIIQPRGKKGISTTDIKNTYIKLLETQDFERLFTLINTHHNSIRNITINSPSTDLSGLLKYDIPVFFYSLAFDNENYDLSKKLIEKNCIVTKTGSKNNILHYLFLNADIYDLDVSTILKILPNKTINRLIKQKNFQKLTPLDLAVAMGQVGITDLISNNLKPEDLLLKALRVEEQAICIVECLVKNYPNEIEEYCNNHLLRDIQGIIIQKNEHCKTNEDVLFLEEKFAKILEIPTLSFNLGDAYFFIGCSSNPYNQNMTQLLIDYYVEQDKAYMDKHPSCEMSELYIPDICKPFLEARNRNSKEALLIKEHLEFAIEALEKANFEITEYKKEQPHMLKTVLAHKHNDNIEGISYF